MTRSLHDTLEDMQAYVLEQNTGIATYIVGDNPEFKHTRLDVYRDGYALRLLEILEKNFPILHRWAGEELFDKLGRDYIYSYPSNHFSIRYFGRHFHKFLSTHAEAKPAYAELAFFEWVLDEAMDAPDAPQLRFDDLANISAEAWATLQLITHPSLQIASFFYDVPKLWLNINEDKALPEININEQPVNWLVWRFNRQVHFCPVSSEQLWMLQSLQSGKVFAEVCGGLCQWLSEEKVTQFAAETLRNWIVEGIFSAYKIQD